VKASMHLVRLGTPGTGCPTAYLGCMCICSSHGITVHEVGQRYYSATMAKMKACSKEGSAGVRCARLGSGDSE
jgi:hypothetical protein